MNFKGITDEYMLYGNLFALCNRIQTLGDDEFGDVTMKQNFLLICLGRFEANPSLNEMAKFMGCSYQNVRRMADALEKKGYINISLDPEDHRRCILSITPKVANFQKAYLKITKEFMHKLYQGISKEEITITQKTLERMNENLI